MALFDVVIHHGGEFVRDKRVFYRGGVQTIVSGLEGNNWGVSDIENIVTSWGYEKKKFRVWGQYPEVFDEFFQVNEDHIAKEISGYSIGNKVHGHIYVEHNVLDITVKAYQPRCIDLDAGYNEEVEMFSSDDDGVKVVRFGSFYFCFEGCKKGFTTACRPFVGVDGCHLKTRYGDQLLISVGRDPNYQYFPLAFRVVETECKESWSWFMQLLMEDIGQDKRYVFISLMKLKKAH